MHPTKSKSHQNPGHKTPEASTIPRNTFNNFVSLLMSGQILEILKVLRRRFLNFLKIFRRIAGIVYDQPVLVRRRERANLRHLLLKHYGVYKKDGSDKKGYRVALVLRDGTTYPKSSAFIRLISPLTSNSVKDKISIELFPENTTKLPGKFDFCIVQRTAFDNKDDAKKLISNMHASNVPVIVDSDDAFHSIDTNHPEHAEHTNRADALNYLFKEADQVWLSTDDLSHYIPDIKHHIVVMPNSLDERLWRTPIQKSTKDKPVQLIYMGTVSHDSDFAMIIPALEKIATKYPNSFELTVIGVSDSLPDHSWIERIYQKRGGSIYPKFVNWFLKQGPFDIGLAPLVDTKFNQSKSDIKCLDYLAAGVLPMVSDVKPYSAPDLDDFIIRVKNTPEDWERTLENLIKDPQEFRKYKTKIIPRAQKYIQSQRSSEATGKKLLANLEKLKK